MEKDEVIECYKNLLDDVNFEKLEIGLQVPNIFQILGISRAEIRHSNFLGWLLNPNSSHSIGSNFLIRFLRDVVILQPNYQNEKNKFSIFDINTLNLNNIEIRREWRNIDLLIVFDDLVVCIENKVDSKDHSNQLKRYREIVEKNFPNARRLFVYLTPTGLEPTSEEDIGYYTIYSYKEIINNLNQILEIHGDSLNIKILHYISDYVKILELEIMNNNELNELADKIYQNHKELINFIIENRSDTASLIYPFFEKCVQEFGWIIGSKSKGYVRFLTQKLKDIIPNNGNGWNQKESFLFEIDFYWNSKNNNIVFKTVISPNGSDVHKILKKALEEVDGHKKPKGNQWLIHFIEKENFDIEKLILEDDSVIIEKINEILHKIKNIVEKVEDSILKYEEELKPFIENKNV